jgi:acyl-coenzyme A synthetase/AMP-(fatty) acid ligase
LDDTGGNSEIKIRRVPVDESERVRISSTIPDAAVIRYTSGTTGLSKGVIISHRAVLERTEVCGRLLRLDARDRVVNSLSISYHFVASALSCIRLGATLIDCAPLSGIASDNSVSSRFWDYRPTVIFSDPKTYQLLNRTFPATKVEPAPRLAISTSGTLNSAVSAEFTSNFGIVITPVYGIIEIGLPIWNLSRSPKDSTTLGKCVSPYEFKIVQDTKASLPPETPGELLIRGPGTFSGYIRDGGQVIVQDSNQWFPTGDMVALDHNGVIKYKGRKSALIELDSITLAPDEIESILLQLPEIEDVRVLAESDPERGKVLVALIVLKNREGDIPLSNLEVGSLRSKCLALGLDGIKLPYEFRPVDHIARTGSGKVLRY